MEKFNMESPQVEQPKIGAIGGRSYRDKYGNLITKEEHERIETEFHKQLSEIYEEGVKKVLDVVPFEGSPREQVKAVFDYLLQNVVYNHDFTFDKDGMVDTSNTVRDVGLGRLLDIGYKELPFITGKGICGGLSKVVNDILSRLGIEVVEVKGDTRVLDKTSGVRVKHAWNAVKIGDEDFKHLDIVYAMYCLEDEKLGSKPYIDEYKGEKNPYDFFLVSSEELKKIAPHCNYDEKIFQNSDDRRV